MKKFWSNFKLFLFIVIFIAIVLLVSWIMHEIGLFFYKFRMVLFLIGAAILCITYGFIYFIMNKK